MAEQIKGWDGQTYGGEILFDGQHTRIELPTLQLPANRLTLVAWFRVHALPETEAVIFSQRATETPDSAVLRVSLVRQADECFLRAQIHFGHELVELTAWEQPIGPDQLHFFALTLEGGRSSLWLDGALCGRSDHPGRLFEPVAWRLGWAAILETLGSPFTAPWPMSPCSIESCGRNRFTASIASAAHPQRPDSVPPVQVETLNLFGEPIPDVEQELRAKGTARRVKRRR